MNVEAFIDTTILLYFIITSAQSLGCSTLYTEGLQHGQRFGSLHIVNPFR